MTAVAAKPDEQLRWFAEERAAFRRVLETGDLLAPVPSCPGWDLARLAGHLGGIHRWAREAVLVGPSRGEYPAPEGRDGLVQWYEQGADALEQVLCDTDPDRPCWTFGQPSTVGFWMRRQAHETAMHRWDAQSSQGRPAPLDPMMAADGVAEVVQMLFPRQVWLGRQQPLSRSLSLRPPGVEYVLAGDGTGTGPWPDPVDASVAGPAEPLLLLLWGRTSLDDRRLRLSGSSAAAREVLGARLTP